ncbi:MAG: Crp/Fnr family transcriptional regulator [Anaerolineae bacterium]
MQKGALRLLRCTPQGHEVTLKIYGPGDVFGLLAVSGDYSGGATVEAIHKTEVIALLGQDIRQLMYTHGDLGVLITDLLVAHVHHAHKRLGNMTALRVDERLAASLLELAEKFGELCSSGIMIDVPLTQQDLAQFIGATPETVSRTLKTWSQTGLLQKERRHIILLKPASLLRIADGHSMT